MNRFLDILIYTLLVVWILSLFLTLGVGYQKFLLESEAPPDQGAYQVHVLGVGHFSTEHVEPYKGRFIFVSLEDGRVVSVPQDRTVLYSDDRDFYSEALEVPVLDLGAFGEDK
jgi:hypothetical protein